MGDIAKLTPIKVAIPSPPLKLVNIDFQCPNIEPAPAANIQEPFMSINPAIKIAKLPLATSARKTNKARRRPTFQNRLAVPALVLPVSKISTPFSRAAKWANGMDPNKYPTNIDATNVSRSTTCSNI